MAEPASEIAGTVQAASVIPDPSPAHDINPTTSASEKHHVLESAITDDTDSIPSDVVDPSRMVRTMVRQKHLPPLPDLRFEQSYLASLKDADTWGRVAWITIRDQVILPLVQGTLWTLALSGWRYWNRNASLSGRTLGSRIRRWWYEVNNWKLPPLKFTKDARFAGQVEDCELERLTLSEFLQFYKTQFANAGSD
ncbi:DUF1770 domain-containing protein [Aspergillus ruber CBS 135680]|uniref:DUF1770-domain-containing protein n=1 Tax=Aspergillus ruber (strain CBS 135680) TaxID=1388766 RepID=A0A017SB41_ASPRC|nr:DUF1770-domain-containing protein [Aspergillus ruber CBS 135680]EYE93425.1 DUF1770-domain-containing protein [Aspergillus ruber CBS 135680]